MPADPVFLVGAGRSGTTWLQEMLGAHPAIATPHELYLFNRYLEPLVEAWGEHLPEDPEEWRARRHVGLPSAITEGALYDLLREIVERVHGEVLALKPGARVVLEKAPRYALYAESILRILPGAKFIHLLRDGRDVVGSMLRAHRGWGRDWAPATARDAITIWRLTVEAARGIARLTDRYAEVRYEELASADGPAILERLFAFCGVESDAASCQEIYRRFSLEDGRRAETSIVWGGEVALREGAGNLDPPGFRGVGGIGTWRRDLSLREQLLLQSMAGAFLRELGYADERRWVLANPVRRLAARIPLAVDHRARLLAGFVRGLSA